MQVRAFIPDESFRSHAARLFQLTLAAAMVAGLGEFTLRLATRLVRTAPVLLNPSSLWLSPLSAFLILTPCVVGAWLLGRVWSQRTAWLAAVGMAAFVVAFDLLIFVPRIHPWALAIVAVGIASQVVRLAERAPALVRRTLRWGLATAALTAAGGVMAVSRGVGSHAQGDAPEGAPNVLLLVLDTVRALELSAFGYPRPTSPHLDALARDGVRFDRAVATAPWTLPTHASLFTGRFQRDLSVTWKVALDTVPPTLAEYFGAMGYATGGFVANLRFTTREYGLGRGFEVYSDYAVSWSQLAGSTMLGRWLVIGWNAATNQYVIPGRKDAATVVDEFLAWQSAGTARPFFAFLNLFDAHEPYAPGAPYDLRFALEEPPTRALTVGRRHSPAELQGLRDAYDGAIASLDAQVGRLLAELEARGVLDNTIVVVTADHGEEFAEHGHVSHGNGLHFPALHVPLFVVWPKGGVPRGTVVSSPVSLVDVAATITDLAGISGQSPLPGASLAPLWRGDSLAHRSPVLSELYWVQNQPEWYPISGGDMRSLVLGRFHFISGPGEREELYDIDADPLEQVDLLERPELTDTLQLLREQVDGLRVPEHKQP